MGTKNLSTKPKRKRQASPFRRGEGELYRDLQQKSMAARISRHFTVQYQCEPGAQPLFRKRETDAGFDVTAYEGGLIEAGATQMFRTGLHLAAPPGYWYSIMGRSSMNKLGIFVPTNVIDAEYTGEILVALHNTTGNFVRIDAGNRIAQIVFLPILQPSFELVADFTLSKDARGHKGFGSSGK